MSVCFMHSKHIIRLKISKMDVRKRIKTGEGTSFFMLRSKQEQEGEKKSNMIN